MHAIVFADASRPAVIFVLAFTAYPLGQMVWMSFHNWSLITPPTYLPHALSLDSCQRLWTYQQGLPTYLANTLGTALLTITFTLLLAIPAAYALARFPIPGYDCSPATWSKSPARSRWPG